jgi:hypothetical protein
MSETKQVVGHIDHIKELRKQAHQAITDLFSFMELAGEDQPNLSILDARATLAAHKVAQIKLATGRAVESARIQKEAAERLRKETVN